MLVYIAFILTMFFAPFAAAATAQLLWMVTQRGELFSKWQDVLDKLRPHPHERYRHLKNLIYKPLGGCMTCFRQFITNLSCFPVVALWCVYNTFPTSSMPWYWGWTLNFVLWVAYSSISFVFGALIGYEKKQTKVMEQFADAKIKSK